MRLRIAAALFSFTVTVTASAQGAPPNGPRSVDPGWFALTGADVVTEPGQRLPAATIVLREGIVAAIGGEPPAGATIVDCTGLVIYPGLIDAFVPIDVPAADPAPQDAFWNPRVQPQRRALDGNGIPEKERQELRGLGFTAVAMTPTGGNVAGTSAVVLLDDPTDTDPVRIVRERCYLLMSFAARRGGYPSSEMGAIAVIRQALYDARWFDRCRRTRLEGTASSARPPNPSISWQALADTLELPLWFDTRNELQALRAARVAAEFTRPAVVVGSGMEFRRLEAIAANGTPIIVPVAYPDAPDVSTTAAAESVSLRHLRSWEQAPTNSKRLLDAGLPIAWTTARLEDRSDFYPNLRDAIACGIGRDQALAALTTTPARLLGVADRIGTIAVGKLANLLVVDGRLFDEKAEIREVWVGGRRHVIHRDSHSAIEGTWTLSKWPGAGEGGSMSIAIGKDDVSFLHGERKCKVSIGSRAPERLSIRVVDAGGEGEGTTWLRMHVIEGGARLSLSIVRPDGSAHESTAERATTQPPSDDGEEDGQKSKRPIPEIAPLPTPLGGYGFDSMPEPETIAIVGATVWPCDGRGVIRNGALVAREGKILFVGPVDDMPALPPGVHTIEAQGKHVTPGLIDCHSHTGISGGVNEGGQAVTAEVRVADVIQPDDGNWYRQLAGGVTTVNQLHGSANAIGGQNSVVKIRYGVAHPDEMRFEGAPPGIKFALGENPRRTNGLRPTTRYPSTRMGVQALIRDRFVAAEAYRRSQSRYRALTPKERARTIPPRTDLELQAIAEIIAGKRWIHCHSYRQDEILMLCRLAAEYGIRIGTFQHVLEGYKVADAIAANAVGASSFSDWWAYKFEVYDAIPENGAIMHEQGVSVSFNSDSDEHARRLNTEAGKAVKYGGVDPVEALCFVTKNPAVQLGIYDRTGSLTRGKDADIALWSGDPLSYLSRCEITWVDGRRLFSIERDAEAREAIRRDRARLLQLAAGAGKQDGRRDSKRRRERDAYWRAEDTEGSYCCRNVRGESR